MDKEKSEAPGKPRVYRIIVSNLAMTKQGWKSTYRDFIFKDGYDEFIEKYGELDD
jgi:hypothetical protein